jgi:hypothetical protein
MKTHRKVENRKLKRQEEKVKKIQYENVQNANFLFQISIRNLIGNERSSNTKVQIRNDSRSSFFRLQVAFQILLQNLKMSSKMTKGGASPGHLSYSATSRYISHFQTSFEFSWTSSNTDLNFYINTFLKIVYIDLLFETFLTWYRR